MAVAPEGSLFWRRYTRKPANSLLKICQQSTWITGTKSYGLMRWRLICLVPMASSMSGGDQVRSTKISVSYLQSSMVVGTSWSGLHECCRCWRVTFHWGKHELQHVLRNTAAEYDPLPPETGSQGSVLWYTVYIVCVWERERERERKREREQKHIFKVYQKRIPFVTTVNKDVLWQLSPKIWIFIWSKICKL